MQYWRYLQTVGSRRPRHEHRDAAAGHRGDQQTLPGDDRARARGDALRDRCSASRSASSPRSATAASLDHASLVVSLIGVSIPIFFLAIILKCVFAVELGWLPTVGRLDVLIDLEHPTNFYVLDAIIAGNWSALWDALKHLILPAIALGSIPLAIIARITRAAVLDVQNEDYVRTARAKGISPGHRRPAPRAAQRDAADLDDHRPPGRPAALRRGPHRDGVRLARASAPGSWTRSRTATTRCSRAGSSSSRSSSCSSTCSSTSRTRSSTRGSGWLADVVAELEAAELELEAPSGLWRDAWRRLRRNPGAIVGFVARRHCSCSSRSSRRWIAPYDPREQNLALLRERLLPRPVGRPLVRPRRARPRRALAHHLRRALLAPDRRRLGRRRALVRAACSARSPATSAASSTA